MEVIKQLKIHVFEQPPSPAAFASEIELRSVPAVFTGCIKNWRAFTSWNPNNGGLYYLQDRVGSSTVEAMMSRSAPVFYGDLRRHERVPVPFSTFISFCKQRAHNSVGGRDTPSVRLQEGKLLVSDTKEECILTENMSHQIYLAQVSIMNSEDKNKVQLEALRDDIQVVCACGYGVLSSIYFFPKVNIGDDNVQPPFLETKELMSINLWMNNAEARSSTHYDPHHNVLCIVAGRKKVTLWPPSATPLLYPMPIHGEASNHSSVALEDPDFSLYPRAKYSMDYSQQVVLSAGDALFIPEGWFHQVDSDNLTVAVNFWWQSNIMSNILEHMDAYYLRSIMRRLMEKEMHISVMQQNQVLDDPSSIDTRKTKRCSSELLGNEKTGKFYRINSCSIVFPCAIPMQKDLISIMLSDSSHLDLEQTDQSQELPQKNQQQEVKLHQLEQCAVQALHELVSLVHDRVKPDQSQHNKIVVTNLYFLEDDPVAKILWSLDPQTLQKVFIAMVNSFPRTLEALVLHLLSPVGAEVLTRKFEEMDQQSTEEHRNKFYEQFYSAFDDQFAAMDAILNGKESFALQAFKETLEKYVLAPPNVERPSIG
ncbi:Lysine-specific demethylase JMJ31 [Linum perenne]